MKKQPGDPSIGVLFGENYFSGCKYEIYQITISNDTGIYIRGPGPYIHVAVGNAGFQQVIISF